MLCLLVTVNVSVGNYSSWKEAVRPGWKAVKHFGGVGHGAILFLGLVGASSCAALPEGSLAIHSPVPPKVSLFPQLLISVLVNCSADLGFHEPDVGLRSSI